MSVVTFLQSVDDMHRFEIVKEPGVTNPRIKMDGELLNTKSFSLKLDAFGKFVNVTLDFDFHTKHSLYFSSAYEDVGTCQLLLDGKSLRALQSAYITNEGFTLTLLGDLFHSRYVP